MVEYKDPIWYNAPNMSYLGYRSLRKINLHEKIKKAIKRNLKKKNLENLE